MANNTPHLSQYQLSKKELKKMDKELKDFIKKFSKMSIRQRRREYPTGTQGR